MQLILPSLGIFLCILPCSVFSALAIRSPPINVRQDPTIPHSTACGGIIDQVNQGYAYFQAAEAFDCLTSIPFNAAVATRFINYVNTTIQFQSTLAYLKNPPPGYQQRSVDLSAGLQLIQQNITTGAYKNQYAFEAELQKLLYSAHDGHISLTAGVLSVFSFLAPFSISSVSSDGQELPKVYLTNDVRNSRTQNWKVSAIRTMNDEDIFDYLTDIAGQNSVGMVEPNADWNMLFNTPALDILGEESVFAGSLTFFPGDQLNVTFENGTTYNTTYLAVYNNPFPTGPLTTGGDFYNYFVLGLPPDSYNDTNTFNPAYAPSDISATPPDAGVTTSWQDDSYQAYPNPDIAQPGLAILGEGVLSGYFLPDKDAAVLSIPSFDQSGWALGNFTETVDFFIMNSTQRNLSRVVIDLQQNSGGAVALVYSVFMKFFPDLDPTSGSRRRNHHLANLLGESYTAYFDSLDTSNPDYLSLLANEWVVTPRINDESGRNFTSWAEYYGPVQDAGDVFSRTERYNLSSELFDIALFVGFSGSKVRRATFSRPFTANHIVLLTDGLCSSSCALFVDLFTEAGARTIVIGGRPSTGPMQAASGNRGAAPYTADRLDQDISFLSTVNETAKRLLPNLPNDGYRDPGVVTKYLGVNLRDQIRNGDTVPMQFKYEPADCRIFYTFDNLYNMSRLWRDAIDASDIPSLCIINSTGYRNSSKLAPQPLELRTSTLNLGQDRHAEYLDVVPNDGLQDTSRPPKSRGATSCASNEPCDGGSQCRPVSGLKCGGSAINTRLCLPAVGDKDECPMGHTFNATSTLARKEVAGGRGLIKVSRTTLTGFCVPDMGSHSTCPKH